MPLIRKILFLILVLFLQSNKIQGETESKISVRVDRENEDPEIKPFVPTKEWQKVKKGQPIPAGIHSRLNLQTGEVEAKLLDKDDEKNTAVTQISKDDETVEEKKSDVIDHVVMSKRRLEEIFSKMNDVELDPDDTFQVDGMKKNFRSYEELKKEFEDLKMSIKSDSEIMAELLERIKVADQSEEIVSILTDIEYLLHQTDNAVNFAKAGGISSVVLTAINSSNSQVASAALRLLGSASQSNPKVQIAALEVGAVEKVLRLVTSNELSSSALYALSCMIRRFPLAQKTFVKHGGLAILASLFDDSVSKGNTIAEDANSRWKAQVKAVTLLHDLMLEQQQADEESLKQYMQIGLKEQIHVNNWCELFPVLLTVLDDHDAAEKGAEAMLAVWDTCKLRFLQAAPIILEAQNYYIERAKKESELINQEYFLSMAKVMSKLAKRIQKMKDEL